MKRILALMTESLGGHGGIAQYNRDWLDAVRAKDATIELVAYTDTKPQPEAGIEVRYAGRSRWRFFWSALRVANQRTHDSVFCAHLHLAPVARLAAMLANAPMWLQLHGVEAWQRPSRLRDWGARGASLVTCVSRFTRSKVREWLDLAPESMRVLPNTVSEFFSPGERDLKLLDAFQLKNKLLLLTVGRLAAAEAYKGHDRVIRCLPELLTQFPELAYVIVGDGDDRSRLEAEAARHGVQMHVIFAGQADRDTLRAWYRSVDLFVMPSTGEGFGIAFLEAMACGLPAVGLNQDGSVDPLSSLGGGAVEASKLCQALADGLANSARALGQGPSHRFHRGAFNAHAAALANDLMRSAA